MEASLPTEQVFTSHPWAGRRWRGAGGPGQAPAGQQVRREDDGSGWLVAFGPPAQTDRCDDGESEGTTAFPGRMEKEEVTAHGYRGKLFFIFCPGLWRSTWSLQQATALGGRITSWNYKHFPSKGGVWSKQQIQLIVVDKPEEYRIAALRTSKRRLSPCGAGRGDGSNRLAPSTQIMREVSSFLQQASLFLGSQSSSFSSSFSSAATQSRILFTFGEQQ